MKFSEIIESPDAVMGVKAVWGRSRAPVMCFGSRGASEPSRSSVARSVATRAIERPFLITLGGGKQVSEELGGRAVELVRVTGAYGDTTTFVSDPAHRLRLEQWPIAVALSNVYAIDGEPHLVRELGFSNMAILLNAFDNVVRPEVLVGELCEALRDVEVTLRDDLLEIPGFRDPGKVIRIGSLLSAIPYSSEEGRKLWKLSRAAERDPKMKARVKRANREKNGGELVCEGCGFRDATPAMFDAHHLNPIATGVRQSTDADFAVLCPTCHRWAHEKAVNKLHPISIAELQQLRSTGVR